MSKANFQTIIRPKRHLFDLNLSELWRYRDLVFMFVRRDFATYYKQTILGPLWFVLQPLLTTAIFLVIFGRIANIPTDGIPPVLFYLSGVVMWNYFAECLKKTSNTFIANENIFGKVYFPRLSVPFSVVISNLMTFVIQLVLLLLVLAYYVWEGQARVAVGWNLLLFPLLVLQIALLGLGFGVLVSSLTTKYKDLVFLVQFGVQLWMYVTPIAYPLSQIPERWQVWFALNPMTGVVENFRFLMLGQGSIDPLTTWTGVGVTLVVFVLGVLLFNRVEKSFMDVI